MLGKPGTENFPRITKQRPEAKIKREGRIVTIETENATYSVIYGLHDTPEKPERLPDTTGMLFLEFSDDWTKDENIELIKKHPQYESLMQKIKEKQIPIYFGDVDISGDYRMIEKLFFSAEMTTASVLFWKLGQDRAGEDKEHGEDNENQKPTRRTFFKKTLQAVAGTYLASAALPHARMFNSDNTSVQEVTAELDKRSDQIHPELRFVTESFREVVLSFKENLAARLRNGKKPVITTIMGASHTGMEKWLQSPQEEKLEYLKKFKPILKSLVVVPETFYTIRVDHPDGRKETIVVEELKEIWNSC